MARSPGANSANSASWWARVSPRERRRQGFIGPTMASHAERAYTGMVEARAALDGKFTIRSE